MGRISQFDDDGLKSPNASCADAMRAMRAVALQNDEKRAGEKEAEAFEAEVLSFAKRLMKAADGVAVNQSISKTEMEVSLRAHEEWVPFLAWITNGDPCRFQRYDSDNTG